MLAHATAVPQVITRSEHSGHTHVTDVRWLPVNPSSPDGPLSGEEVAQKAAPTVWRPQHSVDY